MALLTVMAIDNDNGPNGTVVYRLQNHSIDSVLFEVDEKVGLVSTAFDADFDREDKDRYELVVVASDLGSPSLSGGFVCGVSAMGCLMVLKYY